VGTKEVLGEEGGRIAKHVMRRKFRSKVGGAPESRLKVSPPFIVREQG